MIRAGRDVVDIYGVAELRKETYASTAQRKPWGAPGWPAPVNHAVPGRGVPKCLWDRAQVQAYLDGKRVPEIDAVDNRRDLLDIVEVAAHLNLRVAQVRALLLEGRLPAADAQDLGVDTLGVDHWSRGLVETMRPAPSARRPAELGPPTKAVREEIRQRLLDAIENVPRGRDGELNKAAVARAAGVSRLTVIRFLRRNDISETT